jgi:hypothetical protein
LGWRRVLCQSSGIDLRSTGSGPPAKERIEDVRFCPVFTRRRPILIQFRAGTFGPDFVLNSAKKPFFRAFSLWKSFGASHVSNYL